MNTITSSANDNFVDLIEVGPRDGLQSQPKILDTDTKLAFIDRLIGAGARRIEVISFVNPKRVPQMADADELVRRLPPHPEVRYIALALNRRGFERAAEAGLTEIHTAVVASDTFSERNQGVLPEVSMDLVADLAPLARAAGIKFGVTVSAAFGCPFEGRVAPSRVVEIVARLAAVGVDEIALADTIGVAVPVQVQRLIEDIERVREHIPLRMHFHNTRNTAIANVYAALTAGVRAFDVSCGGVGGCPFAPGATGNVGTEDVLYMLENMGYHTDLSLPAIVATTQWLGEQLAAQMPAALSRASAFPPAA